MYYISNNELAHYGILGMKWGVRRFQNEDGTYTAAGKKRRYSSTSISSAIARKQNAKVDKSFNEWKENAKKKEDAINKGKTASDLRLAYEADPSNKQLKKDYKVANNKYKKALNSNTTYRKGSVRKEVGKDLSRKYLSAAKKIEKQLKTDPNNRELQKQYNSLMSKHDVERAKARRAQDVGKARSRRIATMKRGATIAAKTAVTTTVVTLGLAAANKYLLNDSITLNADQVIRYANVAKNALRYIY